MCLLEECTVLVTFFGRSFVKNFPGWSLKYTVDGSKPESVCGKLLGLLIRWKSQSENSKRFAEFPFSNVGTCQDITGAAREHHSGVSVSFGGCETQLVTCSFVRIRATKLLNSIERRIQGLRWFVARVIEREMNERLKASRASKA